MEYRCQRMPIDQLGPPLVFERIDREKSPLICGRSAEFGWSEQWCRWRDHDGTGLKSKKRLGVKRDKKRTIFAVSSKARAHTTGVLQQTLYVAICQAWVFCGVCFTGAERVALTKAESISTATDL